MGTVRLLALVLVRAGQPLNCLGTDYFRHDDADESQFL